ncbi:MAG: endolytic transglycosylase MltG, partial [Psychroserpens sp.]|nr:endolytic transglycosylase MltG [Psychroserpens sp.]
DRMLKEYNRFWNDNRKSKAKAIGLTQNDVMTLASIVHEESKQAVEQPRIAGVYMNRIRVGMPLQADPTLKFAAYKLPEYKNTVIKRVLNKHKEIDSPYNTYKNAGLPPGLIAMPDISAINAVLNYEKHDYFYFAANAKKLGFHKFAKSLAQHNKNAREYQRYLTTQGINK